MLFARILGVLLPNTSGVSPKLFFIAKDWKWLRILGQPLSVGIVIVLIFIGIYFLERFLLVV